MTKFILEISLIVFLEENISVVVPMINLIHLAVHQPRIISISDCSSSQFLGQLKAGQIVISSAKSTYVK
jgi:aspartate-semialdehyde dehydrogenase